MIRICLVVLATGWFGFFTVKSGHDGLDDSVKRGEQVYLTNCMSCHMINGEGLSGTYPSLVKRDTIPFNLPENISIILKGQKGEIMVNGETFNTEMPSQNYLTDEQIADVLNYMMNSWGNKAGPVTPDQVKSERGK